MENTNTIDRAKFKTASTDAGMVELVKLVIAAQAFEGVVRPVVEAEIKAELEANVYMLDTAYQAGCKPDDQNRPEPRRFTYEDHCNKMDFLMVREQWPTYHANLHTRYMATPFAYLLEGKAVGYCPLLIAEGMVRDCMRAMLDHWYALTDTFDTDMLLCFSKGNGLANLKNAQDTVIGLIINQNKEAFN